MKFRIELTGIQLCKCTREHLDEILLAVAVYCAEYGERAIITRERPPMQDRDIWEGEYPDDDPRWGNELEFALMAIARL